MVSLPAAPGYVFASVALRYQKRGRDGWRWRPTGRRLLPSGQVGHEPTLGSGPCRRDPLMARVEAVLMLSTEPITARRLSQVAELADPTQARTIVRRLNGLYKREGSAFRVEELAGGWQLLTHPGFGGWLRKIYPDGSGVRLSGPGLETLAVVAYRQPVLRAEVEAIRGVQCGEMLRQLMDRELVRIVGRSDDLGRPFLYGTTARFLRAFGLRDLDDLPRAPRLRARGRDDIDTTDFAAIPGADRDNDLPKRNHDLKEESQT
jgi:segregation and condensation protein B